MVLALFQFYDGESLTYIVILKMLIFKANSFSVKLNYTVMKAAEILQVLKEL